MRDFLKRILHIDKDKPSTIVIWEEDGELRTFISSPYKLDEDVLSKLLDEFKDALRENYPICEKTGALMLPEGMHLQTLGQNNQQHKEE